MAVALLAFAATSAPSQAARNPTLAGTVHDTAGVPIADAEVIVRETTRGLRTNARGEFTVDGMAPGTYHVWFRRLGFRSVEYTWRAQAGERTSISVAMDVVPRELDPIVVRAEEDKQAAQRASILGLVIDPDGKPIADAQVQLVGADIGGVTRANGGFLFKPLAPGAYVIRVRKLGYAPAMLTEQLVKGDDREVLIYMEPLAKELAPVVVMEKSGYGKEQVAYEELEQRKRWQSFKTRFLGPEDLKAMYGVDLWTALTRTGYDKPGASVASPQTRSINIAGTSSPLPGKETCEVRGQSVCACILLNGTEGVYQPLTLWSTKDLELLEIYPPRTELTGTVMRHFRAPECEPISLWDHPTYYVLWFKKK